MKNITTDNGIYDLKPTSRANCYCTLTPDLINFIISSILLLIDFQSHIFTIIINGIMSDTVSPIKYFLSGGFGGICTVIAGHPLDTIKVIF